jgi:hypothetical protein
MKRPWPTGGAVAPKDKKKRKRKIWFYYKKLII